MTVITILWTTSLGYLNIPDAWVRFYLFLYQFGYCNAMCEWLAILGQRCTSPSLIECSVLGWRVNSFIYKNCLFCMMCFPCQLVCISGWISVEYLSARFVCWIVLVSFGCHLLMQFSTHFGWHCLPISFAWRFINSVIFHEIEVIGSYYKSSKTCMVGQARLVWLEVT